MLIQSLYSFKEPYPSLPGCCHLIGILTMSSKGLFHLSTRLDAYVGEEHVKASGFRDYGPMSHASGCEVSSLVRKSVEYNDGG